MWPAIAEEGIHCEECWHDIAEGSISLSQMPPEMPEGFQRRKYQNFCIECEVCNAKMAKRGEDPSPCFVRRLDHWYTRREEAPGIVGCARCGAAIPKGTRTVAQKLYDWPAPEVDLQSGSGEAYSSGAAAGMAVGIGIPRPAGGWENLSLVTQQ